jgi:diadenosine tetraphosphate (Ap4A) HIT family hydrolase
VWQPRRIGLMIVGEEVPHTHLHVVPIDDPGQLSFARVDHAPDPAALDDAAQRIRTALTAAGCAAVCE